jgi:hypothetical protein
MVKFAGQAITASIVFSLLCLVFSAPAYAYLDPGTGSYILQLLIGVLIGAAFAVRIYWKKICSFLNDRFSRRRKNERQSD